LKTYTGLPYLAQSFVFVYNIAGFTSGPLILDTATIVDMFLGRITAWDDPELVALNPGLGMVIF
jgi:phosphate transport system substrate-binding protein